MKQFVLFCLVFVPMTISAQKQYFLPTGNSSMDEKERPLIEVYLPKQKLANGCAVVLCPGYNIDVYRNSEINNDEEDVDLQEFADEIDQWILDALYNMGCDTAKNVLSYTPEEVASRADLEIETVNNVFRILQAEFENDN